MKGIMMKNTRTKNKKQPQETPEVNVSDVMNIVKKFLDKEKFKYIETEEQACEIIVQGYNLIMQLVYYVYKNHLILRIPHFIRNVDVMRPKLVFMINRFMEEILDIRFEVGEEGKSISATCQLLLEDALPTERQLRFLTMLIMNVADDYYPKFMQAIYGKEGDASFDAEMERDIGEGIDEIEEGFPGPAIKTLKIN
jgi:hypothetical protein